MKKYKLFLFALAALVASSCADLDELKPVNDIPSGTAINNKQSADAALAGMYDALQDPGLLEDGWLMCPQFFSDEANATGTFPTRLEFGNLNVFPANTTMAGFFSDLYEAINRANNIIEIIPTIGDDPGLTDAIKADYVAQAKMVRGFCYLYLERMWGDVPLITTATKSSDLGDALNVSTTPAAQVMAQVIKDFTDAVGGLDATRVTPTSATAKAASALLARVALYQSNWGEALSKAEGVLGAGFDLTTIPYLSDQIFILGFSTSDGNTLNFFYGAADVGGRYSCGPTTDIINAFEPGDLRFSKSLDTSTYSVNVGLKYPSFGAGISGTATDPVYFIRHAEMVLIAAEAAAEMGDFTKANAYFSQVRARAGLPALVLNASNYVDAIRHERFVEFAFEGPFRLIDLRRRGIAQTVLAPYGYDACDKVWPLPQRDIDRNVNLTQNDCCNC